MQKGDIKQDENNKSYSELEEQLKQKVFDHYKTKASEAFVYHNFQHASDTVEACDDIASEYNISDNDKMALGLAAWLHDVGITDSYDDHESESVKYARKWLPELDVSEEMVDQVAALILSTRSHVEPTTLLEEILHDADLIYAGQKAFFHKSALLRLEWSRVLKKEYDNVEWQKLQLDFLIATKFYTQAAAMEYGSRREKNIQKQRKLLKKSKRKTQKDQVNKLKSKKLGRGIETMYRSTYRNHINLSSIADAKATMMISLNTIIMSVIITVVGSGYAFSDGLLQRVRFTVPMTILLISSLLAVIFAVISAKPDVTKKKVDLDKIKKKESSVLFFGNFSKLELKSFIKNMRELKADRQLLYDNMSVDIYYLGKVLTKKYLLIRYSYTIFITGLTLSVLSFLGILIYSS